MTTNLNKIRHNALMAWHSDAHPLMKNEDGSPKTFYHGTSRDFDQFKRSGMGFHFGTMGQANDRIEHKKLDGKDMTGENVMPVHLNIKNPLRMDDLGSWHADEVQSHLMKIGVMTMDEANAHDTHPKLIKFLQKKGHDGIVYRNEYEREGNAEMRRSQLAYRDSLFQKKPSWHNDEPEMKENTRREYAYQKHAREGTEDSFIAFEPHQVKSAIGNTAFTKSKKITEAKQGELFRPSQKEAKATNFKNWFGDSKAVDKNGRPQKMYHTTRNDFHTFETGRVTKNSGTFGNWETQRHAIFVTPHLGASQAYGKLGKDYTTGANVMPVHVSAKNPLDLRDGVSFDVTDKFKEHGIHPGWLSRFDWGHFDGEDGKNFVEAAKKLGHDSVIFHDQNPDNGGRFESWALFHPHQVKSVYNKGTYSGDKLSEGLHDFVAPGVRGHIDQGDWGTSIYEWSGDGTGKTRAALKSLKRPIHVMDIGEPGTDSHNYWKKMHAEGLVDHLYDGEGTKLSEGFITEDEVRAAFKKAYPDGWKMEKNPTGETPWKDGVESSHVIRHFGSDGQRAVIYGNHHPEINTFEVEYSEVFGNHRKGTYTHLLDKLRHHMTVVSDMPGNNVAQGAYTKLGARQDRNGRFILDHKPLTEETMTRKLTLSTVETEKKQAALLESIKDKELIEAAAVLLESGLFAATIVESMFDDKLSSPFAMDRMYIATHGTDAHREQLLKDEDAMVRFGIAQKGHLTHLNALASDPHPMVRDQVARRGDEDLAQKMSQDPHATVRSSAFSRLAELAAAEEKKKAEMAEAAKEAPHYETGTEIRLVEDGRFGKVKAWFETKKQGVFYVVGFPDGKTDMLARVGSRVPERGRRFPLRARSQPPAGRQQFCFRQALQAQARRQGSLRPRQRARSDARVQVDAGQQGREAALRILDRS
jgi:hypothetical protein